MTTTEPSEASLSSVPLVGVAVNAALASIKILAGFFGNSYALIADGIESTADIVTSLVVWGGLRVSVAPADEHICSLIPSFRMISATEVPDSACLKANAICSSETCFFPIRKTHPFR